MNEERGQLRTFTLISDALYAGSRCAILLQQLRSFRTGGDVRVR